jgi:hypothetical protein
VAGEAVGDLGVGDAVGAFDGAGGFAKVKRRAQTHVRVPLLAAELNLLIRQRLARRWGSEEWPLNPMQANPMRL